MPYYGTNEKEEVIMDEMKIKLFSKFMRGVVSKQIKKAIYKRLGYDVDIQINDLDVNFVDGETSINTNVELKLDSKEFEKIINSIGLD